jgi:hypothetical protein
MDVGVTLARRVYDQMQIDEEWSVLSERGFEWWGHDLKQAVWAEPAIEDMGLSLVRVHAKTDVLRALTLNEDTLTGLAATGIFAGMSGLVYDGEQRKLSLRSSVYVHEESVKWLGPLFALSVALQAADAHAKVPALAELLDGEPDYSHHPRSGPRADPDDMLAVHHGLDGKNEPSRFDAENCELSRQILQETMAILATSGGPGLTAEFACGHETSLLEVSAEEVHPELGAGVQLRLTLPFVLDHERLFKRVVELNALEQRELTRAPFTGSWCPDLTKLPFADRGFAAFVSFVPNAVYQPSLLPNLCLYMGHRAAWASQRGTGEAYGESMQHAKPAGLRWLRRR